MSSIDYAEKIPNNDNIGGDRTLQRALELGQERLQVQQRVAVADCLDWECR